MKKRYKRPKIKYELIETNVYKITSISDRNGILIRYQLSIQRKDLKFSCRYNSLEEAIEQRNNILIRGIMPKKTQVKLIRKCEFLSTLSNNSIDKYSNLFETEIKKIRVFGFFIDGISGISNNKDILCCNGIYLLVDKNNINEYWNKTVNCITYGNRGIICNY